MPSSPAVYYFGQLLMTKFRDPAVDGPDKALEPVATEIRDLVRRSVIDCFDSAIHELLFALEEQAEFDDRVRVLVDGVT